MGILLILGQFSTEKFDPSQHSLGESLFVVTPEYINTTASST